MKSVSLKKNGFAFAFVLLLMGCNMMQNPAPTPTAVVADPEAENRISALAEVVPARWVNLVFKNSAMEIQVDVLPGESVTEGQVLLRSDESAFDLAILQAEAGFQRAQQVLEQLQDQPSPEAVTAARAALSAAEANLDQLERTGAREINQDAARAQVDSAKVNLDALLLGATPQQIKSAQADVNAARAALEQARNALESAVLVAPFDGVVIEVYARDGENFSPGQPVVLLADLTSLQVETTDLSEVDAARIQIGDSVIVSFDALPDLSVTGSVVRIAEKASPGSAVNFTTVIRLDQIPEGLRWGMTAFIEIQAR